MNLIKILSEGRDIGCMAKDLVQNYLDSDEIKHEGYSRNIVLGKEISPIGRYMVAREARKLFKKRDLNIIITDLSILSAKNSYYVNLSCLDGYHASNISRPTSLHKLT